MAQSVAFKRGDVVVHPRRPEWGEGTVDHATNLPQEGEHAQRLVVIFANHGRVTINTAVAPLIAATAKGPVSTMTTARTNPSDANPTPVVAPGPGRGWLDSLASSGTGKRQEH